MSLGTDSFDPENGERGGWQEYRRLVLEALKRLEKEVHTLNEQMEARDKASVARWEALNAAMRKEIDGLEQRFLTRGEFLPVRLVIYGVIGTAGVALVLAALSRLIR